MLQRLFKSHGAEHFGGKWSIAQLITLAVLWRWTNKFRIAWRIVLTTSHVYMYKYACVCTHQYVCHIYVISLLLHHRISWTSHNSTFCSTRNAVTVSHVVVFFSARFRPRTVCSCPSAPARWKPIGNFWGPGYLAPPISQVVILSYQKMSIVSAFRMAVRSSSMSMTQLVGGLKLSEKYDRQMGIFPK